MKEVYLTLHTKGYTHKPNKKEVGGISKSIAECEWKGSVEDLAYELQSGRTWCSIFSPKERSKANWTSSELFGVDIDECPKGTTSKELLEHSEQILNFKPTIIHRSFSYTEEKPKYRMIFRSPEHVTDRNLALNTIKTLTEAFGGDPITCEESRLFYGCSKGGVEFVDESSVIPDSFLGEQAKNKPVKPKKQTPVRLSTRTGKASTKERNRRKSLLVLWEKTLMNPLEKHSSGYQCLFNISLWMRDESHWFPQSKAEKFLEFYLDKYSGVWKDSKHTHRAIEIYNRAKTWKANKPTD